MEVLAAAAAMFVALALQVATNFANDYSDGMRGTDGGERVVKGTAWALSSSHNYDPNALLDFFDRGAIKSALEMPLRLIYGAHKGWRGGEKRCAGIKMINFNPYLTCDWIALFGQDANMAEIIVAADKGGAPYR